MTAHRPSAALLSAVTTEHFTLQTARNATIAETSSRTSLFMGAVTGAVVALALVSQMSQTGPAFDLLALTVLPTVLLVGLLTYARLLETSIEDLAYGHAISRIRAFYVELDPAAVRYLLLRPGTGRPVQPPTLACTGAGSISWATQRRWWPPLTASWPAPWLVWRATLPERPSASRGRQQFSRRPPCCSPCSATSRGGGGSRRTSSSPGRLTGTNSGTTAAEQTTRPI